MADKPSGAPPPYGGPSSSPYPPQPAHLVPSGGANQDYYASSPSPHPAYGVPAHQQGYYQNGPPPPPMGYQQGAPMNYNNQGYQQGPPMGYQQYPPQRQQQDRGVGSGAAGGCLGALCAAMACCCCLDILF